MGNITMTNEDLENDIDIILNTNRKCRGSKSIEFVRERLAIVEELGIKWMKEYGTGSYDNTRRRRIRIFLNSSASCIKMLKARIVKLETQNRAKSRLQGLRIKTAREMEAVIHDGTLQHLRLELERLKMTVSHNHSVSKTPDLGITKEAAHKMYEDITLAPQREKAVLGNQAEEMRQLFGIEENKDGE